MKSLRCKKLGWITVLLKPGVVKHKCLPNTEDVEAGGSFSALG